MDFMINKDFSLKSNAYEQISGDGEEGCEILRTGNGMLYIDTVQKILI